MFRFTVKMEMESGGLGLSIRKVFVWPKIPSPGETIFIGSNGYHVFAVHHYLDRDPFAENAIIVFLKATAGEIKRLSADTEYAPWKNTTWVGDK